MRNALFNTVRINKPKRNVFDLSHEKKMSLNMGELIPILFQEVVPGDSFRVNSELFLRFAPMVAPVMHRINVYTHYFFVPYRLVWSNWESFITGGEDGLSAPTFPLVQITNSEKSLLYKGTLADYMGIPPATSGMTLVTSSYNAMPFRAYQCIYNEYYRDQNLTTKIAFTKNDTVDATERDAIMALRNRCWEKDYFTSALPWTQRGADVTLPGTPDYSAASHWYQDDDGQPTAGATAIDGDTPAHMHDAGGADMRVENLDGYDITINDLRRATRIQKWLENNARAGSRYVEQILAHFGVKSSDARLQRPEYLGGGKQPVVISEVLNTSATATEAQGNMAGHGVSVGNSNSFKKYFEEHGFIIGIMSVLPRTAYQQGLPKIFNKLDKYDYFWPEFANLGEQIVKDHELYFNHELSTYWTTTFGYQSRYAEYKFANSSIHGDFHDDLEYWHMGRQFSSQPALNTAFVTSDPTHRIFAVTTETVDKVYAQIFNDVKAIRPMPIFGTPNL